MDFNAEVYLRVEESLRDLPPLERAEMGMTLVGSYTQAYVAHCSIVSAARAASTVPPVVSVPPTVSTGCGSACRRVGSLPSNGSGMWPVPSDLSVNSARINSDGRCYLALAARGSRTALYRKLGPWPTFARLLASPASKLCSTSLESTTLLRVSDGTWHLADMSIHDPASTGAESVATVLARMVEDNLASLDVTSPRWDGTLLRELEVREPALGSLDVPSLSDKVGGMGDVLPVDCIRWPEPLPMRDYKVRVCLGGAPDSDDDEWRYDYVRSLGMSSVVQYVFPRHPWSGSGTADVSSSQLVWERDAVSSSDAVVLAFLPGVSYSAALVQLGGMLGSSSLYVVCPVDCFLEPLLRVLSDAHGFQLYSSLDETIPHLTLEVVEHAGKDTRCPFPSGYCYASLLEPSAVAEVAGTLGDWPSVWELLTMSLDNFSLSAVARAGLSTVADGRCHIGVPGDGSCVVAGTFLSAVSATAASREFPSDSLGYALHSLLGSVLPVGLSPRATAVLPSVKLGGLDSVSGASARRSSSLPASDRSVLRVRRGPSVVESSGDAAELESRLRRGESVTVDVAGSFTRLGVSRVGVEQLFDADDGYLGSKAFLPSSAVNLRVVTFAAAVGSLSVRAPLHVTELGSNMPVGVLVLGSGMSCELRFHAPGVEDMVVYEIHGLVGSAPLYEFEDAARRMGVVCLQTVTFYRSIPAPYRSPRTASAAAAVAALVCWQWVC